LQNIPINNNAKKLYPITLTDHEIQEINNNLEKFKQNDKQFFDRIDTLNINNTQQINNFIYYLIEYR